MRIICLFLLALGLSSSCLAQEPAKAEPPQITVNILGAVQKPSHISLPDGATILDALASAGSVSNSGDLGQVIVIHKVAAEKPRITRVNVKKILDGTDDDVVLKDGDTISVAEKIYSISY